MKTVSCLWVLVHKTEQTYSVPHWIYTDLNEAEKNCAKTCKVVTLEECLKMIKEQDKKDLENIKYRIKVFIEDNLVLE